MFKTKFTATALAASLALVPATRVAADAKDFIAGAVIGGVVGSQIQKQQQRNKAAAPAARATVAAPQPRAQRSTSPSIPATDEGRRIQTALNYFGFDAGSVDGQIGSNTRDAVGDYQAYLGYPRTGELNDFEQRLLLTSYDRAMAGGDATFQEIAAQPDGTRGLLKVYRADIADGAATATSPQTGS